jgi:hypothetical protein
MNIKTLFATQTLRQAGSALLLTMIMAGVALAMLAAALSWSSTSTRLTYRSIQYTRSQAAAEAATDKVISQISHDFLYDGEATVVNNLNTYRNTVPMPSDSAYWNTWLFNDASGNTGRTFVQRGTSTGLQSLPPYSNLLAYVSTYTVVSDAKDTADITGPVHSNGHLYVEPDSSLTFESGVGAVLDVLFQRDPLDTRGAPAGAAFYVHPLFPLPS